MENNSKTMNLEKRDMMENLHAALEKRISTEKLANFFGVKSQTIRRSLCINGNYLGLTPLKMPNGRLMWKYSEALELIKQ